MVTLQDLKLRIRSVTNIKKITATMKLVATSKLKIATRNMEIARPFLSSVNCIAEVQAAAEESKSQGSSGASSVRLLPLTSDRGLCGSVNGVIIRTVRGMLRQVPKDVPVTLSIVGTKGRVGLFREFGRLFDTSAQDLGEKKGIRFADLAPFTEAIATRETERTLMVCNKFVNTATFTTETLALLNPSRISECDLTQYEFESEDRDATIQNYYEWYLAATVFGRVIENAACEMSARMGSMDNATRNAGEILKVLKIKYNRGRQAAITSELAEIIGGAEALKSEEGDEGSYNLTSTITQAQADQQVKEFWRLVEAEAGATA